MQRPLISPPSAPFARRFTSHAVLATAALLAAATAAAAPGDPDTSFAGNGTATDPFQSGFSEAFAVTVQTDGKIVVAGEHNNRLAVARYNDDGTLDGDFNAGGLLPGTLTLSVGATTTSAARAITLGDGGTIILAGESESTNKNLTVVRLASDGTLDTGTFNSGSSSNPGANITPIGAADSAAYAVALQEDGYIVTAGYAMNGPYQEFALARYTSGGDLDTTFNINGDNGVAPGTVMTYMGSSLSAAQALAIQPDGGIVAAGTSSGGTPTEVVLERYNTNGTPDANFGTAGRVSATLGTGDSSAYGMTLQPDGKIIVAGQADNGTVRGFALARFNTDGTMDPTFGTNGTVITAVGTADARAEAVALQPDGAIVAAGFATDSGGQEVVALARYNADGSLDTGFHSGGTELTSIGTGNARGHAVALQTDAKIVVGAKVDSGSGFVMGVARYLAADTAWDLTPDQFHFDDVKQAVLPNTVQTSNIITINGLGRGIQVPVTITDGEYAKGGSSAYTVNLGWAKNGDQFNVRHTSVAGQIDTTLTVGGMISADNPKIVRGTTTADAFSSLSISILGGGGGSLAALSLLVLAAARGLRRRRQAPP